MLTRTGEKAQESSPQQAYTLLLEQQPQPPPAISVWRLLNGIAKGNVESAAISNTGNNKQPGAMIDVHLKALLLCALRCWTTVCLVSTPPAFNHLKKLRRGTPAARWSDTLGICRSAARLVIERGRLRRQQRARNGASSTNYSIPISGTRALSHAVQLGLSTPHAS